MKTSYKGNIFPLMFGLLVPISSPLIRVQSEILDDIGSGHPDLSQARANQVLAGDERGASRRTPLLGVVVGEGQADIADSVDIRGAVTHLTTAVVTDVLPADIVAPEDENVWIFICH